MSNPNILNDIANRNIKEKNESCFLSNQEEVHYDSIILLEMFYIEDFNLLFDGLDLLYANLNGYEKSKLNYRDILQADEKNAFRGYLYLPPIVNSNLKDHRFFPKPAFLDLGDDIDGINITLQATLPSTVTLQIQVSLNPNISDKINSIIYTYHEEIEEKNTVFNSEITIHHLPYLIKKKEIIGIKEDLKNQIIIFLSAYFKGIFFTQAKKHISYVPSIDLFSLNYPEKSEDTLKWLSDNHYFFICLDISVPWINAYKYENYLFLPNSLNDCAFFPSYSIIADRQTANADNMYFDIKTSIQHPLDNCSFELLAFKRWLEIEERTGTELNLLISKESEYVANNQFKKAILNREEITKYLFYFERFKIEINMFDSMLVDDCPAFESLDKKNRFLFRNVMTKIKRHINYIDEFVNTLNRHSDNILALKNIEYNKNIQNSVLRLTYLIIIISIVQIILSIIQMKSN